MYRYIINCLTKEAAAGNMAAYVWKRALEGKEEILRREQQQAWKIWEEAGNGYMSEEGTAYRHAKYAVQDFYRNPEKVVGKSLKDMLHF